MKNSVNAINNLLKFFQVVEFIEEEVFPVLKMYEGKMNEKVTLEI